MAEERLILTPLRKALQSLEAVLGREKDDVVRDATIQRFEYTYEIAWKMMKRHLEWAEGGDADRLARRELFREAARIGLVESAEEWFEYHQARNRTSHVYDEVVAEEVYESALRFAPAAPRLLEALERVHDRPAS